MPTPPPSIPDAADTAVPHSAQLLGRLLPVLTLVLCVAGVLLLWGEERRQTEVVAAAHFREAVAERTHDLRALLDSHEALLRAVRGLFVASERVSQEEWERMVESLDLAARYPAVNGVAFAAALTPAALAADPEMSEIAFPPGPRPDHFIITHIGPHARNAAARGYDMGSHPGRRATAEGARDSGEAVMSAPLTLITPGATETDLIQMLPVYRPDLPEGSVAERRAALLGWAAAGYHARVLFGEVEAGKPDYVRMRVRDGATLLFDSVGQGPAVAGGGRFRQEVALGVGGRSWQLEFLSTPRFEAQVLSGNQFPVLATGTALAAALSTLVLLLSRGRLRAQRLATAITAALRESEARYRQLFVGNKAVELLIDPADGRIVDANAAAATFYGYPIERLKQLSIADINTLSPEQIRTEMAAACREERSHFLFRHRLATGELREVEVHSGPVQVGGRELLYSIVHDITRRKLAEEALKQSERRYRTVVEFTAEGYWALNPVDGRILEVNGALCGMLGRPREAFTGHSPLEFAADEESRTAFEHQIGRIGTTRDRLYEVTLRRADGAAVHVLVSGTTVTDGAGGIAQAFAFLTDITAQKRAAEQQQLAASFFEHTAEAVMVTDADNRIVTVNPAFARITGYTRAEVLGRTPDLLKSGRHDAAFYRRLWEELTERGEWQGEIWNRRKDGAIYPEWLSIVALRDPQGRPRQYLALFSDITRRKQDEERIWRQANYDPLTSLPNRSLFFDRLSQALAGARRSGAGVGLLFIDLDRFKWVNDTLGHSAGDLLLREAAERLTGCVRETDTVARLGGDEFTVILPGVATEVDVEAVVRKALARLAEPFLLGGHEAFISASIGITLFPRDGESAEELLRNADAAMYRAKEAGRDGWRFFTGEITEEAARALRLQNELRRALRRQEFAVYYQPIVDLRTGRPIGAEALLRWHHPERGVLAPGEFIQLAEETGLIVPMEQWVLAIACRDAARWAGDLYLAVNISSIHCRNRDCRQEVLDSVAASGLPATRLRLEITERLMLEESTRTVEFLMGLRRAGVGIALDDFGTGYSSLSYLKRFPVDTIKIDRSFVAELPGNIGDVALVEAIIAMADRLGLSVVAEGVESAAQRDFLHGLGCAAAQGFLFSPPLPAEAFAQWVADWEG